MGPLHRPDASRALTAGGLVALALLGAGAWWLAGRPAAVGPEVQASRTAEAASAASAPLADHRATVELAQEAPSAAQSTTSSASKAAFSFDTAPDLYQLATDSINSSDPGVLFNGLDAVNACTIRAKTRSAFEQLAAGPQTLQALAAKELLRRCGGFFTNDFAANQGLRKRYLQRLEGNEGRYLHRAKAQQPLDERFAALLATQDWQMFVGYMHEVMPGALKAQGIEPGSEQAESEQALLFGVAWMQVACDMGRDCSGRNIMDVAQCAEHGHCPGAAEAELAAELNEHQLKMFRQFRERISAAVRARDLGFFGLGPRDSRRPAGMQGEASDQ
jgi:hypothetical protein